MLFCIIKCALQKKTRRVVQNNKTVRACLCLVPLNPRLHGGVDSPILFSSVAPFSDFSSLPAQQAKTNQDEQNNNDNDGNGPLGEWLLECRSGLRDGGIWWVGGVGDKLVRH